MVDQGSWVAGRAVDLDAVAATGPGVAAALGGERDLETNLVVLPPGAGIAEHVNDSLDVLVVVLAGTGTVTIDGTAHPLAAHHAVVVPRGARRAVTAGADGLRYLTVHHRRGPMTIGAAGPSAVHVDADEGGEAPCALPLVCDVCGELTTEPHDHGR